MYISVCVRVLCTSVRVCLPTPVHREAQGRLLIFSSIAYHPIFSLTEPGVLYLGWIKTLSSSICLSLVGLQPQFTTLDFYVGARDLNLGTQACTASTSPSEPSPPRRLSFGYS